ncbi:PREDICTED: SH2 domain-containing protein 3C-like [Apaloderma vittatum]|uniref:SH2 domain-containing protein 3C-like n=1 Tax=Apaloderma vittatum TaxID=57397 RepID=UPI000521683F|nr:PREDICTED: SH2 domain-containing protein 3C-like [Apaloderma vittatum]
MSFVPPTMETTSSFNPAAFQSLLIPLENKPLEMAVLKKVKELLAEVDVKTLAKHITKVDCLISSHLSFQVARILGVTVEMQRLMGVSSGLELLTLPHARLEQTGMVLRQRHTEGAILYEKKLKPFLKSLNEGKEGPPLTNTTFPHIIPLVTLLERDEALTDSPEPWESSDNGVEGVMAHLEAAFFALEFQRRLLWGSRGAESSQAERYEKFDKVLTALSHKLEPAVRFSEL